jgi:hypothetical protein
MTFRVYEKIFWAFSTAIVLILSLKAPGTEPGLSASGDYRENGDLIIIVKLCGQTSQVRYVSAVHQDNDLRAKIFPLKHLGPEPFTVLAGQLLQQLFESLTALARDFFGPGVFPDVGEKPHLHKITPTLINYYFPMKKQKQHRDFS